MPLQLEQLEDRLAPSSSEINPPVTFQVVNRFATGLQAQLTLKNDQASAISAWQLTFKYTGSISSILNAQIVSHQGTQYVIQALSWDNTIKAGATQAITFVAVANAATKAPSNFVLQWSNDTTSPTSSQPAVVPSISVADASVGEPTGQSGTGTGYYHTSGNQILDVNNQPVRIAGVNWFGMETSDFAPGGLQIRSYKDMMDQMKQLGFNTIRLPFSDQLFDKGSTPSRIDYTLNPDLNALTGLQIMDKIVAYAGQIGLRIILDHERSDAGEGPNGNGLWYTAAYPENRWATDWVVLAAHYARNPTVIGADLANEPHDPANWGQGGANDWRLAAQRAGNAILSVNPGWLVFVEGVQSTSAGSYWWGGNLSNVAAFPVQLSLPGHVIYSAHENPPSYDSKPWFSDPAFPNNLPATWDTYWGYLYRQNIAPVWLGAFGSRLQTIPDQQWASAIISYIDGGVSGGTLASGKQGISWTWSSWGPNSTDTGGILNDDWASVIQAKLFLLQPAQSPLSNPGTGFFHTTGNQIFDANNQPVRIAGVTWFGLETSDYAPGGLQVRSYKDMMDQMRSLGFNTIRLPFSDQLFDAGSTPSRINYTLNPDLQGLKGVQIIDKIVAYAGQIGLRIILDHERSSAGSGPNGNGLWVTTAYPYSRWIADWLMLASRYAKNPTVIGADLSNEPHDPANWGKGDGYDWRIAAIRAGNAILTVNPNWLIFVEGVQSTATGSDWWGGNLQNAVTSPVQLFLPGHVVYAPHDNPPSYGPQPWFSDPNYPSNLPATWDSYWGYLYRQNIAPVMLGDFGSRLQTTSDQQWASTMISYLNGGVTGGTSLARSQGLSWAWASWGPNSADAGGILNDDWTTVNQPKMSLLQPALAPFGGTSVTFTVTLSAATTQPVTVRFATADGTALAGRDYVATSGTLTFKPGVTSQTVTVAVLSNAALSGSAAFTLQLTSSSGGILTRNQATATILAKNPTLPTGSTPTVSIGNLSVMEPPSGTTNAVFTVSLSAASAQFVSVAYATANGTAFSGHDYTSISGLLLFGPGQTQQTISVPILSDGAPGPNLTFSVGLLSATNAVIGSGSGTGTIVQFVPSLSIANTSVTEPMNGTINASFVVTLSAPSTQSVTVAFATADGTAIAGRDYSSTGGQLTFSPGQTTQTINVPVFNDVATEANETFTVQLTNPTNATIGTGTATGTILQSSVVPTLSIGNVSVTEPTSGTTNAVFTVTLSAANSQAVTVTYATANGSALAGRDYTAVSGQLTFNPGQTQLTVSVPVLSDASTGLNETFTVQLSSPINATIASGAGSGTGTIVESSTPTPKAVLFTKTDDWGSGFTASMTVNNLTTSAIDKWTVEFDLAANITTIWNAVIASHVGNHYVIQNAAWNGSIAAGGTTSFGFQGAPGLGSTVPANVKLNGVPV